tara:strand:+ start:2051 stop:2221 length:171 start_codon:yes stop_codon:yes gene_type:complete
MVLSNITIKIISKKLTLINQMIKLNNGKDLEKVKDELLSIIQEIDIENYRCFTKEV